MSVEIEHRLVREKLSGAERSVFCACGWTTSGPRKTPWPELRKRLRDHSKAAKGARVLTDIEQVKTETEMLFDGMVPDEDGALSYIEDN
jgi:hypothetical protein